MPTRIIGSGLPDSKALTVDQFFQYLEQLTDEPTKTKLYRTVAWVHRCIELRANNLSAIPYAVLRGETELEGFPTDKPIEFKRLFSDLERDLCIFGAGYWLRDKPRTATRELQRLNPATMRVKVDDSDPTAGIKYFEQEVGGKTTRYKPEQIVYFRYYNPDNDLGPGVAPLQVAMEAAGLAMHANIWASQFFSHGAIPAVILHTEQNVPDDELKRVGSSWKRLTQGASKAWRTLVLRRGLKPEVIGQPIKDLAMMELLEGIRTQVASAFGVPETMIADAANYATAKEHRLSFYQDTVIPLAGHYQEALNEQMFEEIGLEFQFKPGEIEAIQKDEAEKAEFLRMLVDGKIITKDEAREALGYEPMSAEQMDELKPPMPDFTPGQPPGGPSANPSRAEPDVEPNMNKAVDEALAQLAEMDLEKWERKALNKGTDAPFESEFIPPEQMAAIRARLESATTDEEVKAAFSGPFRVHGWQAYP